MASKSVHLIGHYDEPVLKVLEAGHEHTLAFHPDGTTAEGIPRWHLQQELPVNLSFRIELVTGEQIHPSGHHYLRSTLDNLWVYHGQLFNYQPTRHISPPRVEKIVGFEGRLSSRSLYVYLPRGYDEQKSKHYPVLYMHDGQNVFASYEDDSFAGSWRADYSADQLIEQARMQECLIVGIANGGSERLQEYLPPYSSIREPGKKVKIFGQQGRQWGRSIRGRADQTLDYYRKDVHHFISQRYRLLEGREHVATAGSSMGGLFSSYIAFACSAFAKHHAIMSPSYWITKDRWGRLKALDQLKAHQNQALRLWLDSGTLSSPGHGDDGQEETRKAKDILLRQGFELGDSLMFMKDEGASHNESSWAKRLPQVFEFLFPT